MNKCQINSQKNISLKVFKKNNINQTNEDFNEHKFFSSQQILKNEEKLLEFISDKKKLHLQSCFDDMGSREFLSTKNKAMEKIELNEIIDSKITKNESSTKKKDINKDEKKKLKLRKKISKKKSHIIKKNRHLNLSLQKCKLESFEENSENKNFLKERKANKSAKAVEHVIIGESKEKEKNKLEKESTDLIKKETKFAKDSEINIKKNKTKKNKVKIKKNHTKKPKRISITSINTVDSKLFNNENDYKNFKSFMSNDDLFLEEIVKLMKLNNH